MVDMQKTQRKNSQARMATAIIVQTGRFWGVGRGETRENAKMTPDRTNQ
jgi:hypothetical protein